MSFRITGLDPRPFQSLFGLDETALAEHGAYRYVVDGPGFPDRVELREGKIGETMVLLNYEHQPANSPYRSSHAIFVREGATRAYDRIDEIPETFATRVMSFRAFDASHMMLEAELGDGASTRAVLMTMLADDRIAYVHAHYAKRGCFAATITRA